MLTIEGLNCGNVEAKYRVRARAVMVHSSGRVVSVGLTDRDELKDILDAFGRKFRHPFNVEAAFRVFAN